VKPAILIVALTAVTGPSDELAILEKLPEAERLYVQNRLEAEATATKTRKPVEGFPDLTPDGRLANLRVGTMGEFPGTQYTVAQVLGEGNVLVRGSADIWVEGIDTSAITDDQPIDLHGGIYWVKGTKTYTTVAGATRTVRHVVRVDENQAKQRLPQFGKSGATVRGTTKAESLLSRKLALKSLRVA
jgi:hypothetical protein